MPLQQTSGNVTADAYGGGVAAVPNYIEDVFSTYLYTGNGSVLSIDNKIDLTKGGLVWVKNRGSAQNHVLTDTARGDDNYLSSNTTSASASGGGIYLGDGFAAIGSSALSNASGNTYASWTFRKQPKFFDVVTWTGNGADPRDISHSLGSAPGCVIIKCTSNATNWSVYHIYDGSGIVLNLNSTAVTGTTTGGYCNQASSTTFTVNASGSGTSGIQNVNASGYTYVAYLFAHNAGGFGLTGTDNVISCGSYTGNGSATGPTVTLNYEPQWVLVKRTDSTSNWTLSDNMRGQPVDGATAILYPNASDAEVSATTAVSPTATGFQVNTAGTTYNANGGTYIYIAIRRGPMKVPTDATKVFTSVARSGTSATATITAGFPIDLEISKTRNAGNPSAWFDRLRGATYWLRSSGTTAEATTADSLTSFASNTGVTVGADASDGIINYSTSTYANWMFGRAPSFFDEVCWTANVTDPTTMTVNHNLGVAPQMIIKKSRQTTSVSNTWRVYHIGLNGGVNPQNAVILLNSNGAEIVVTPDWNDTAPTATQFSVGYVESGYPYVAYLFATCAGVSKVGSYTGNGSTQTINCGFAGGARFVLIKRTDSTGDWYVYDTARGMTTLTDPYLLLNSTAAESATLGSVTTVSTGFAVNASILAAINTNAASYIFLAIA